MQTVVIPRLWTNEVRQATQLRESGVIVHCRQRYFERKRMQALRAPPSQPVALPLRNGVLPTG